jgi:hypothetical protein
MNRRGFLAAVAGAFVADPEKLLWTPGAKLISIPAPSKVVIPEGWAPAVDYSCFGIPSCLYYHSEKGVYREFLLGFHPSGYRPSPLGKNGG